VIEVENIRHYLVNSILEIILSTKLLLFINHNKNIVVKCENRTLKEIMNDMLISSEASQNL